MKSYVACFVALVLLVAAGAAVFASAQGEAATSAQPMDIYYADKARGAAPGDDAVLAYINKKFNINFHYTQVPGESLDAKFTTMIASGDGLDFYLGWYADPTNPRSIDTARAQGLIVPLDDLLAKYGPNLLKDIDEKYWALTRSGGKTWFVPNLQFASKRFMYVRQDWLGKLGYAKPPATLDEFEAMLRKMKQQNPGGQSNFYPFVAENFGYLYLGMLGTFVETAGNFVDTDGALKPEFFHRNYRQYLETIRRWYADGLINPDQSTVVREQMRAAVDKGQAGVWITWFGGDRLDQIRQVDPTGSVTFLRYPVGPSGTGGSQSVGIFSGGGQVIMSHTSEAKRVKIMQMLDWFQTRDGQLFQYYGIEGQQWVMQGDYVTLPSGVDPKSPPYLTRYMVAGGNMYAHYIPSLAATPLYREALTAATNGNYPSIDPPDFMYPYDWTTTKSIDYLADLETLKTQMVVDIMTGKKPVSYFDEWLKTWKSAGGSQYLIDLNAQYQKLKAGFGG